MTEAAGQCKFEHGPHLAQGPDSGYAWSRKKSCIVLDKKRKMYKSRGVERLRVRNKG